MKNAEELAKAIINTPPYSQRTGREWTDAIAKALQDAYRKGEEDMRERAAVVSWCHHCDDRCKDIGLGPHCTMSVSEDIRALPLTEGGAK